MYVCVCVCVFIWIWANRLWCSGGRGGVVRSAIPRVLCNKSTTKVHHIPYCPFTHYYINSGFGLAHTGPIFLWLIQGISLSWLYTNPIECHRMRCKC